MCFIYITYQYSVNGKLESQPRENRGDKIRSVPAVVHAAGHATVVPIQPRDSKVRAEPQQTIISIHAAVAVPHQPPQQNVADKVATEHAAVAVPQQKAATVHAAVAVPDQPPAAKATTQSMIGNGDRVDTKHSPKRKTPMKTDGNSKPCLEWFDGEVKLEAKLLHLEDDRIASAPHLVMTPKAFSSPSHFEKPCTIGSQETSSEKCAATLKTIKSLKDQITTTIKKAEKSGTSVNATLRKEFPHNLSITNEPWKSFIICHCTNCSNTLTDIPDEVFWRDIWSMIGMHSFEPRQNLCPPSKQTKTKERKEKITLDDLFRLVWNTEMGKVQDRHKAKIHSKQSAATQQAERETSKISPVTDEPDVEQNVEENGDGEEDPSSSMMFGFHPMVIAVQILGTTAAVTASFFMLHR